LFVHPLSVIATQVAFLLPSKSWHIDAGKLALLGLVVTAFFLFTSMYYFPGGAYQFMEWTDAIVQGKTLHPTIAQRDIGFPLLLLLGGYTVWSSVIGVTIIHALFAVLMPVLVYWSLVRTSPTVAFYAGLFSIISLVPIYFLKWIHHDQTYIFFLLLMVALLVNFLQSRGHGFLYGFTVAALAASFSRQAGNLLFPVLLVAAYVMVRGKVIHYLACALIFITAVALYQWHRYEIFDMRHQPSIPSYTGQQTFYNIYINSREFGVRLSPEIGPNLKHITEVLRAKLQPNVRDSVYVTAMTRDLPAAFVDEYILPFTPDQLIDRIYDEPNYEYYLLLATAEANDQRYVLASWEIVRNHILYAVRFSLRNLGNFLFDPGYSHTRGNNNGFHRIGLHFLPADGAVVSGELLRPRTRREVSYDPLPNQPVTVQAIMQSVKTFWEDHFLASVSYSSILIVIAWTGVLVRLLCLCRIGSLCKAFASPTINSIIASIVAASAFLLYNALATSIFVEPNFRYFHFTELLRTIIAAFAVVLVLRLMFLPDFAIGSWWQSSLPRRSAVEAISTLQGYDFIAQFFGPRPVLWTLGLTMLAVGAFTWWAWFMIRWTW
jgi:hypothetical protein